MREIAATLVYRPLDLRADLAALVARYRALGFTVAKEEISYRRDLE